jgi:endoglucanase
MLSPDHGDFVQSLRMRAQPDWNHGARKVACPDGQRLIGLSHTGNRALCTDVGAADLWAPSAAYDVVVDERHVTAGNDWAGGYTKLQCPPNHFLIGYSVRGAAVSSALCAASATALPAGGRTVWFDRGDNRPPNAAGRDFAHGHYKGQCANDEYAAGIAYTGRFGSRRTPDALYCRKLR